MSLKKIRLGAPWESFLMRLVCFLLRMLIALTVAALAVVLTVLLIVWLLGLAVGIALIGASSQITELSARHSRTTWT